MSAPSTESNGYERHPELWFADGTIVLQAENTQYRVYRGILERYSPILKAALENAPERKPVAGCPVFDLNDSVLDSTPFLLALFSPEYVPAEHLLDRFEPVGAPPWLLNRLGMLRLRDRGAQAVWCRKLGNEIDVVGKGVLAGKTEAVRTDTALLEDRSLPVIPSERVLNFAQRLLCDGVSADEVAEVEERTEGAQHLGRDVALNRGRFFITTLAPSSKFITKSWTTSANAIAAGKPARSNVRDADKTPKRRQECQANDWKAGHKNECKVRKQICAWDFEWDAFDNERWFL
ncbi:hypothetical protein HMN09_01132100 [Mycena chlorophos]|uniref:BTB domain-containing protein n=1 Tax=Mycena chlorophos TaxID=658473 RepID=A0A8H6W1G9_MYCCL|nr:hypothetical protein HMN09_01132100 [Mycena chlorophos]